MYIVHDPQNFGPLDKLGPGRLPLSPPIRDGPICKSFSNHEQVMSLHVVVQVT